ncbi:MAG: hypothetical protein AVDCRST_MAG59-1423 [uncultured Thermomicrobiales bacterium]|uniref:Uncharacterized protein n=1 Tax=uncultured Thermomicrobiales bacterium TaxID=1645740 RepID=A0A6J4UGP1_9BACT|nr:MAG: hypothetical protein AVDCRST_MAG59-1423 [uncultured Thermomicrobiales bacterium]
MPDLGGPVEAAGVGQIRRPRTGETMDDSKFDAWTRRGFGRAAGGAAASLLGLAGLDTAGTGVAGAADRARCRKVTRSCSATKPCCGDLTCGRSVIREGKFCCRKGTARCQDSKDCCAPALCTDNRCAVP